MAEKNKEIYNKGVKGHSGLISSEMVEVGIVGAASPLLPNPRGSKQK